MKVFLVSVSLEHHISLIVETLNSQHENTRLLLRLNGSPLVLIRRLTSLMRQLLTRSDTTIHLCLYESMLSLTYFHYSDSPQ